MLLGLCLALFFLAVTYKVGKDIGTGLGHFADWLASRR
jgi:hypothetical protein